MTAAVRLRLLLAQDRPTIHGYDQDQFARTLHYDRPHETSLELFRWARESTAELLELLTPEEWLREGTHTEAGPLWRRGVAEDLCRPRAPARPSDQRGAGEGEGVTRRSSGQRSSVSSKHEAVKRVSC